jgi:hypothetical protein
MSDYYLDDEQYDREGSVIYVYGDCSCDYNYICRNCLAKW